MRTLELLDLRAQRGVGAAHFAFHFAFGRQGGLGLGLGHCQRLAQPRHPRLALFPRRLRLPDQPALLLQRRQLLLEGLGGLTGRTPRLLVGLGYFLRQCFDMSIFGARFRLEGGHSNARGGAVISGRRGRRRSRGRGRGIGAVREVEGSLVVLFDGHHHRVVLLFARSGRLGEILFMLCLDGHHCVSMGLADGGHRAYPTEWRVSGRWWD